MKLAQKFKFAHKNNRNFVYTAEVQDNGEVRVTWDEKTYDGDSQETSYDVEATSNYIIEGTWVVTEVIIPARALPDTFNVEHISGNKYTLTRSGSEYKISRSDGSLSWANLAYTEEEILRYFDNSVWKRVEEAQAEVVDNTSLETGDDPFVITPPLYGVTLKNTDAEIPVEPEFLPPDDIENLDAAAERLAEEMTDLSVLRGWAKELGVTIEVDEDFYAVKKDGFSFLADNASDLVSIVNAFRTLDKAVDRG